MQLKFISVVALIALFAGQAQAQNPLGALLGGLKDLAPGGDSSASPSPSPSQSSSPTQTPSSTSTPTPSPSSNSNDTETESQDTNDGEEEKPVAENQTGKQPSNTKRGYGRRYSGIKRLNTY